MTEKRSEKALFDKALIMMQANVPRNMIGYVEHLDYVQRDSAYKLQRIMSVQMPKIAAKLEAWGKKYGVL
jgi:hypothetical protein